MNESEFTKKKEDITPEDKENLKKELAEIIGKAVDNDRTLLVIANMSDTESAVLRQGKRNDLAETIAMAINNATELKDLFELSLAAYENVLAGDEEHEHDCDNCKISGDCPIEKKMRENKKARSTIKDVKDLSEGILSQNVKPKGEC